ncbi:MAG: glycogen debranching protein GlgX [Candidatus Latescibacterota bacterium]
MERIDAHPTHTFGDFKLRAGKPLPFGATIVPGGVNFSVYSQHAVSCELVLFQKREAEPFAVIPFLEQFRIGNVYTMVVFDLDYENLEYGFRMDGSFSPQEGHWFDSTKILMDPYAKAIGGRDVWGVEPNWEDIYPHRARIIFDDFDWEDDCPLEIPMEDSVIYELHARGFTRHPSSGAKHPGTFSGIREKIPYLKELGVTCVELLPIHEFDEFENSRVSPVTGERLLNYWGYSNVGFFAPKAGYAATGKFGMQVDELKALVKELHANGLEVILDVVFNHTAEGNERGPYISYRGIDNKTYYMLTPEGYYYNFSGCGNTLNCNNPITRNMILDCLRYWAADYHVDGFRFDLAAILGRDQNGAPMNNPPLLETLAFDPILGKCKLIAEAWDAGGLYQVGSFPSWGRWAEWNGKFRDDIRKFLKGSGTVGGAIERLQGSPDLYHRQYRGARASVNFITAHDGFTLMDMVSYNGKHNEANGENNNDGSNDNDSWNCGWEGPTDDPGVARLRMKQAKNALAMLLASQGVPMILAGDELGNTQFGNNNAYCQDNEIGWLDWHLAESNAELRHFATRMIAFRKAHPVIRRMTRYQDWSGPAGHYPVISWHGTKAYFVEHGDDRPVLAMMLCGMNPERGTRKDGFIYMAMNMHWEMHGFELPHLPSGMSWRVSANTDMPPPEDMWSMGEEVEIGSPPEILVGPRSVIILVSG